MRVIIGRNVNNIFALAMERLKADGKHRQSRYGPVLIAPYPVTSVYNNPCERVLFHPNRDANPFFHLYESLWMLAGRNDVQTVAKYSKNMIDFSDDGRTFWGAYGYRWREYFQVDQLKEISEILQHNPDDRRCVLQMWDCRKDLNHAGKDVPCNVTATFQRDLDGRLDLTIFCRSNDIIWGAYGANAVHFSMLLEYMALWIGCPVGKMYQISVNWHAYLKTFEPLRSMGIANDPYVGTDIEVTTHVDKLRKYIAGFQVHSIPMTGDINDVYMDISNLLYLADGNMLRRYRDNHGLETSSWSGINYLMLAAHEEYRDKKEDGSHYDHALNTLAAGEQTSDWIIAGKEWMTRRKEAWIAKQESV